MLPISSLFCLLSKLFTTLPQATSLIAYTIHQPSKNKGFSALHLIPPIHPLYIVRIIFQNTSDYYFLTENSLMAPSYCLPTTV